MSENLPHPGNSQRHTQEQPPISTQTPASISFQDQQSAQNSHLNAQTAVLLNEFLAKTRRLVTSELGNDLNCTICSELYLRGENPEVPVRLACGHVFGMSCLLKWLSPISRNGNNSCPNCRKPIFDEWDRMGFPAPRPTVPARRNTPAPVRAPRTLVSEMRAPRTFTSEEIGQYRNQRALQAALAAVMSTATLNETPSPLGLPRQYPTQRADRRMSLRGWEDREALLLEQQARTHLGPARIRQIEREVSTRTAARFTAQGPTQEELSTRMEEARTLIDMERRREIERQLNMSETYNPLRSHASPLAVSQAQAASARLANNEETDDEDNGVATMFNAAEAEYNEILHRRQQGLLNERKRLIWIQFREGIVRTIEQSTDTTALSNHDLALAILEIKDLDEFIAERAIESPTWQRILQTFPRLHTEMVTRFDDFRPLPSINIDNRIQLEQLLASTAFDTEVLHRARWCTRLSERLAKAIIASRHEAAVARLAESVASLGDSTSGQSIAGSRNGTGSSERLTAAEETERQRMEDYLLGRTPVTVRIEEEAAASVGAALRAGAESNAAMTTVRRL